MNIIDKDFFNLTAEIKLLKKEEIYYRIRKQFDSIPEHIKNSCMNFFNKFKYWGTLDLKSGNYEEIELKVDTLLNNVDDFIWLYKNLSDYRSKKTLYSILNNWYRYDFTTTKETYENMYDDYFDLDIVKCNKDEIIVDLGAYTGDTILSYIKNYGTNYKKIYCYEITRSTFDILKSNLKDYDNIEFNLKGVGDIETRMDVDSNESASANTLKEGSGVIVTTLDNDIKEPITLIKSDIEGFEQKAINGAKNHILNNKPKLLISVYHKNEDLWKIPKMIHDIRQDYKFYLRHHGSCIYPTEITLIAV